MLKQQINIISEQRGRQQRKFSAADD